MHNDYLGVEIGWKECNKGLEGCEIVNNKDYGGGGGGVMSDLTM